MIRADADVVTDGRSGHLHRAVGRAVPGWLLVLVVAAAYTPLLLFQLSGLWSWWLPPWPLIVCLGSVALAWKQTRTLGPLEPGTTWIVWVWLAISWMLQGVAGLLVSPALGAVAGLTLCTTFAYARGGNWLFRHLRAAWIFLGISALIALGLQVSWIPKLDSLATRQSSAILDWLGVIHLRLGHQIEVSGKSLVVEPYWPGLGSLPFLLSTTLFLLLWLQRSVLALVVLLPWAFFWFFGAELLRIVLIGLAYSRLKLDLTVGWRPEILGAVLLALAAGLVISTDALYRLFAPLVSRAWSWVGGYFQNWVVEWKEIRRLEAGLEPTLWMADASNVPPDLAADSKLHQRPTQLAPFRRTALSSWWVAIAFGLLAMLQIGWLWPWVKRGYTESPSLVARIQRGVSSKTLPVNLGLFTASSYAREHHGPGRDSEALEFSDSWTYRMGPHQAVATIDYPFQGWRERSTFYENQGWRLQSRAILTGSRGPFVEAQFMMPSGRHAILLFREFNVSGEALPVPVRPARTVWDELPLLLQNWLTLWRSTAREWFWSQSSSGCVVELFVEGPRPISSTERNQIRRFLDHSSQEIQALVLSPGENPSHEQP